VSGVCENEISTTDCKRVHLRSTRVLANEGPIRVKAQGTRLYPFVPSGRDFELSLEFFGAIQQIDVPQWQENQMITFEVTDLDDYWSTLNSLGLPERFAGVKLRPPTNFPWGREIHLIDPGGVCWHVREAANAS
jgi:hypothetical protein